MRKLSVFGVKESKANILVLRKSTGRLPGAQITAESLGLRAAKTNTAGAAEVLLCYI